MPTFNETTDVVDDFTTNIVLQTGDRFNGTIDTRNDRDRVAIDLEAGHSYLITMTTDGLPLRPYFGMFDTTERFETWSFNTADDTQDGLLFIAPETGRYYVTAGLSGRRVGDYTIEVAERPDYRPATLDEMAYQLSHGYWDWRGETPASRWAADRDGVVRITYSTELLSEEHQQLVDYAFLAWHSVSGIEFIKQQNDSADIFMEDGGDGSWASLNRSGSVIQSAYVSLDDRWFDEEELLGGYAYAVALHEIGHALGLGHGGNYNFSGYHPTDAMFANDSEAFTIMSYFPAVDIAFSDEDFWYPLTPMPADIQAIWELYGKATVNPGDTLYVAEFSDEISTAGGVIALYNENDVANAQIPLTLDSMAYTVVDDGGNDTITARDVDYDVEIDLGDGARSTVSNVKNGLTLMPGSMIENAVGGTGDDVLRGNDLTNRLEGGAGNDTLWGLDGADILVGGEGDDIVHGGHGADLVSGNGGADRLYGGAGFDTLNGGIGDDYLDGGEAADEIQAGDGRDTVEGGYGADLVYLGGGQDRFIDILQSGANSDDTVFGNGGNDTFEGVSGNDRFHGDAGADRLIGGTGNDSLFGGGQNDLLVGSDGDDQVRGGNGRDRAFLGDGDDLWIDETQNTFGGDFVRAGRGEDTLNAGGGHDTLTGGQGADLFIFAAAIQHDRITDYTVGTDRLHIAADLWGGALDQARLDTLAQISEGDLLFRFSDGDSLLLVGQTGTDGLLDDITLI